MSRQKHIRDITAVAERLGYRFEGKTANQHLRWRSRDGYIVITGSDLRHARAFPNSVKQLRNGLKPRERNQ